MPDEIESLEPESPAAASSAGSLVTLPAGHRVPEGATFYEGADDAKCRVVKADGTRCRAARVRALGICTAHAGQTLVSREPALASRLGNERRRELGRTRVLLGITPRSSADPRQLARLRAHERAEEIARALIDDPLDEAMSAAKRQPLIIAGLDAAFPRMTAAVSVDLPDSEEGFAALGWDELRRLEATNLQPPGLEAGENP